MVKNPPVSAGDLRLRLGFDSWVRKVLEGGMATHSSILAGDPMDRGTWRAPVHGIAKCQAWLKQFSQLASHGGEGNGNPLQYSCLENPMDGGAWWAAVHGVPKSRTQLSDFTFTFHLHALEKEMAAHSSVLAWRIPGMGEPGGLPSTGSHRVGHDWSDLAAAAASHGVFQRKTLSYLQFYISK